MSLKRLTVDRLAVEIYDTREAMGAAAGAAVAQKMIELLKVQDSVRMIFAAAPSQNEFLDALARAGGIDWSRVTAFHMDDYPGLPDAAPQRFSSFLKARLFDRVQPGRVHYLIPPASPLAGKGALWAMGDAVADACDRYAARLSERPIDIVCMGIGENGHIAFNDPPVADFHDPKLVKLVELEEACRLQQVHDGCFDTLEEVPTHALTLTIPALTGARWLYCIVPGPAKREAVTRTLKDPVGTACPATILRRHPQARLYLDRQSAPRDPAAEP
jgi:glucosamine-6-phosphate deaminase